MEVHAMSKSVLFVYYLLVNTSGALDLVFGADLLHLKISSGLNAESGSSLFFIRWPWRFEWPWGQIQVVIGLNRSALWWRNSETHWAAIINITRKSILILKHRRTMTIWNVKHNHEKFLGYMNWNIIDQW